LRKGPGGEVPTVVPTCFDAGFDTEIPPQLRLVIEAWERLPAAIKAGIVALVEASGGARG
jgi:hypothetical protein